MTTQPTCHESCQNIKSPEEKDLVHKQTDAALKRCGMEWHSLVENSPDMIMVIDHDGVILFINRTVSGYNFPADVIGKNFYDYMIPEHRSTVKESITQALQTGLPDKYIISCLGPDETDSWYETRVIPVKNDSGFVLLTLYTNDITSRKKAEDEIRDANHIQYVINRLLKLSLERDSLDEFLKHFLALIISFPWMELEPQCAFFMAEGNHLFLKAYLSLSSQIQMICAKVQFGKCLCGRAASEGTILFADCIDERHDNLYEGITQHGHYCVPLLAENDKLLGVFTLYVKAGSKRNKKIEETLTVAAKIIAGIIERKQAEDKLRDSEQRYRLLIENVSAGIVYFDRDLKIVLANSRACKDFEIAPETITGKSIYDLFSNKDAAIYSRRCFDIAKQDTGKEYEDLIDLRGQKRWIQSHIEIVKNYKFDPVGYVIVANDITGHKQAEQEKAKLEARIHQVEKLEAIGTLSSGIAHDFNNLLMGIQGRTSLILENTKHTSPDYNHLKGIEDYIKSAADLTKQLLSFARGEKHEVKTLNLNSIISKSSRMFGRT